MLVAFGRGNPKFKLKNHSTLHPVVVTGSCEAFNTSQGPVNDNLQHHNLKTNQKSQHACNTSARRLEEALDNNILNIAIKANIQHNNNGDIRCIGAALTLSLIISHINQQAKLGGCFICNIIEYYGIYAIFSETGRRETRYKNKKNVQILITRDFKGHYQC